MDLIRSIREKASLKPKKIVLPRSSDKRVIEAALYLKEKKLAEPVLIQNSDTSSVPEELECIDPASSEWSGKYADSFFEKRKHKGISEGQARQAILDPLYFAASMVAEGDADGAVAGSISTTGDVLRAAIQTIGLQPNSEVVSSVFLMSFDDGKVFTYGDCAVVPYPNPQQLASIAIDSSITHRKITGLEPKTAMLSFSTKGSAAHESIELVQSALEIALQKNSGLQIDGELQFDAALLPEIASRKAPDSQVAGHANVFIFPNLDAGNIAYKITERLAGATATGPIIQGLAKPMMDLSRGCSWEDIVNTACVCALLAE